MGKVIYLILIVFCSHSLSISANIQGKVVDINGNSVDNAVVELYKFKISAVSDSIGCFFIDLKHNKLPVTLSVFKKGYLPYSRKITNNNLNVTVILHKPPILNEEITVNPFEFNSNNTVFPVPHNRLSSDEIFNLNPEIITDVLKDKADIEIIGKGGFSITPSIRGMARRRVLTLLDGIRVVSDRRVGSSISFINPDSISFVDVVKSPSSVIFGSDAIGGVINIKTKNSVESFFPNQLKLAVGNVKVSSGISAYRKLGQMEYYFDFQQTEKSDYFSPVGKVLNSSYTTTWLKGGIKHKINSKELKLSVISSFGRNIGKPDRENDSKKFALNPKDNTCFFILNYKDNDFFNKSILALDIAFNPTNYLLKKVNNYKNSEDYSKTTAQNFTFNTTILTELNNILSFKYGVQWYFRRNLNIFNKSTKNNLVQSFYPLKNGKRDDYSLFSTVKISNNLNTIIGGLRYSKFQLVAESDNTIKDLKKDAYSYFIAYSGIINEYASVYANSSKAYRVPSLSELFYTGISGRKYIIGNDKLVSEKSFNTDIGLKWEAEKFSVKFGLFENNISHLIERYKVEDGIYTYGNIEKGKIRGIEGTCNATLNQKLKVLFKFRDYTGKSIVTNTPLNDIPAVSTSIAVKYNINQGFITFSSNHYFSKNNPGPSEIENTSYTLINISGTFFISEKLFFSGKINNLLNRTYYQNADPDTPYSQGLNLSINIHYLF